MSRTFVITGLGAVHPSPSCAGSPWERIPDAALVKPPAQLRHMDRLGRITLTATTLAWEDAGLRASPDDALQTGIAFGSGYGCLPTNEEYLESILERGGRYGNPVVFQNTVTNAATGAISMVHGLRGPTATLCSGWAAGLEALRFGCQQIEDGQAERMVVCSADSLQPGLLARLGLPTGPRVSEAACALVVESPTSARGRGAHRYAEVAGSGHRGGSLTEQARTLARAVKDALHAAGIATEHVGTVFTCENTRKEFDGWEHRGLHEALGAHAGRVELVGIKETLGESFSAAGTLAVMQAARALDMGRLADTGRPLSSDWVLVTALGGEGSALAVVLRRCAHA